MKKLFSFVMAAALAFGLASCSKDNTIVEGGGDNSLAAVSFTFEKPQDSFVTYADIASANEWNIATLDVYAAVDGNVTKLTETTHYTKVDGTREYTITMAAAWVNANIGKSAKFYFVGNDASSTSGAHTSLSAAATAVALQDAMSNTLGQTAGKYNLIEADGTTKNLLFSEEVVVANIMGKVQVTGQLKRRMARFDIENTIETALVITNIKVSNARANGLIFKNGTDAGAVLGSHVDIAGPTAYDATTKLAESVFYLYPTQLGDATGTTTEIVLEATLNGTPQTFRVNSTENIVANKRYILTFDENTLTFKLTVEDWENAANPLPVEPIEETLGLGTITTTVINHNGVFFLNGNTGGTFEIPIESINGTVATINVINDAGLTFSTPFAISNPVTTITYSYKVTDVYTVTLPVTTGSNHGPFEFEAVFTSKGDNTKTMTLRFVRESNQSFEGILAYDAVLGLNLDGVGTPLFFKWGSLIGIDASKGNGDAFSADDIIYVPATFGGSITDWNSIPFGDEVTYPNTMPALDEVAGLGDPCLLASKEGAGNGVGNYRMPTGNPYEGISGNGALEIQKNVLGRRWGGAFYPFAGYRNQATNGEVSLVGERGLYWSSTPNDDAVRGHSFSLTMSTVSTGHSGDRSAGFLIRCVRAN